MTPIGSIVRDGVRLHVDDSGGDGMPVVLQHGLCGDAGQPAELFPKDAGLRRITLECRGHDIQFSLRRAQRHARSQSRDARRDPGRCTSIQTPRR